MFGSKETDSIYKQAETNSDDLKRKITKKRSSYKRAPHGLRSKFCLHFLIKSILYVSIKIVSPKELFTKICFMRSERI